MGNFLGTIALLLISIVMLRSKVFSRVTAYIGIIANALGLGLFVPNTIGLTVAIVSVVVLMVWWIMIARRLFQLGSSS